MNLGGIVVPKLQPWRSSLIGLIVVVVGLVGCSTGPGADASPGPRPWIREMLAQCSGVNVPLTMTAGVRHRHGPKPA